MSEEIPMKEGILIEAIDVHKEYPVGGGFLEVIKGVGLTVHQGESVSLLGPSGAGKSTLLYLLAGLEVPSKGKILWRGENLDEYSDEKRADFRKKWMGFVFQFFNLLPELSAVENIMLPALMNNQSLSQAKEKACAILKELNLENRASHYPHALSGGEQQRVAIGRALMNNPLILFADEPTGNLDKSTGEKILEVLLQLNRDRGKTLFIATHQEEIALKMSRIIRIVDGTIEEDRRNAREQK